MLKITLGCERGIKKNFNLSMWIRLAVAAVLEEEKISKNAEVNVLLTDDEGIQVMNLEYRQKDMATDVLSFPANELESPLAKALEDGYAPEADMRTGRLVLGDIAISMDRAIAQAKEFGHSKKREVSFLTVHSMLHLTGYDHITEDQEKVMREKQRIILERLNIKR